MNGAKIAQAALAAVLLAGIPAAAASGTVVEVSIDKMKFVPQHVRIRPGTTVKWVNHERRNNHSILFPQEGHLESERLFPGESWERTFDKPGLYPYICGPHPEMTGSVEVAD